jgi:catechol 2,3-dioxygenase
MTTTSTRRASGVESGDIFGGRGGAEPATPETYGLPPHGFRLPEATRLGPVRLQVGDLERSLAFYEEVLGMRLLEREASRALLGTGAETSPGTAGGAGLPGSPLVELAERKGARPAPSRSRTGLFHFAILLPDRPALGRFLAHAGEIGLRLGAGDHLVSESLYLQDPDNLGIEVYADRPRSSWRRVGRELMMATDPLDWNGLLATAGDGAWTGLPAGTVVGHVHLHVGSLAAAASFYSEALGFDRTVWSYPGALFLATGSYHHHLGTNIWAGEDARPPTPDEAQLLDWTIELPDGESLEEAAESLGRAGFPADRQNAAGGEELHTRDPWSTQVRLHPAAVVASSPPA